MMFVLSLSIYLLQPITVLNHKGASLTTTTRRRHSLQPQGGLTHYSHKGASLTTTTRGCHSLQPQGGIIHYNQKGASLTTTAREPHSLQPQGGLTHYSHKGASLTTTTKGYHQSLLQLLGGVTYDVCAAQQGSAAPPPPWGRAEDWALLWCCASQAGPGTVPVAPTVEHSRCTRTRCPRGSANSQSSAWG